MEVIIVELGFYDHISTEIQEQMLLKFKFFNNADTTAQHINTSQACFQQLGAQVALQLGDFVK